MSNVLQLFLKNTSNKSQIQTITFLNHYSYLLARKNLTLFNQFDVIHCDGIVLCLFLRLAGIQKSRLSFDMTSLAPIVFNNAIQQSKTIYFIGGEPQIAEIATKKIMLQFPSLKVAGIKEGFFTSNEHRNDVIEHIVRQSPDIVIASMGTPFQEQILIDLRNAGWMGDGYTSGGFFHQTAKAELNYYPDWVNKFNLRWAYRISDEPKLLKRYTIDFIKFNFAFFIDFYHFKK